MKQGILLVNLGTPDSPATRDVRVFLREFLSDPLVVDLPDLPRWLLVNLLIAPFRAPRSAKEYQRLWTKEGSPLKVHSLALVDALRSRFDTGVVVDVAMRYQNPSIASKLVAMQDQGVEDLLVVPLFPQYADATNLSVIHEVELQLAAMQWHVPVSFTASFPVDQGYINAIIDAADLAGNDFDHTLFSFHGLPERQLVKRNPHCLMEGCCTSLDDTNADCYRAQCFATARAVADKLGLAPDQYTVCFQSRQGRIPWIRPYTDEVIDELLAKGVKKMCVFSPAFVADCLETNVEIGHTYREQFMAGGGEQFYLAPCVNSHPSWVAALHALIGQYLEKAARVN